ncbi:MAG: ABC transporter substrate-binding protein [Candidatus Dormibacteraeota bacterium]|uniref:ABC transporter substrate-binding protein n=1 Tax=Candidatus Aeolococcus gillhamiae TaxID=3127015 RepID=A0A934N244_9BACT|nr:ABC transporter substrate-binding protein [Candidatus Dormibacteraeota bacterium]
MLRRLLLPVLLAATLLGVLAAPTSAGRVIRVGALFPLNGPQSTLAQQEYQGVEIARDMVNMDGGVGGVKVQLDSRELDDPSAATAAVQSLRGDGVPVVIGTYSSALSVPASAAASAAGITYWEAGAVADRVTGRALPDVFRVGASGANLGANSATFTATVLAPRLGLTPRGTRVSVVLENDDYGHSVADNAVSSARSQGLNVVSYTTYNAHLPNWPAVLSAVQAARPNVLILASYITDGVSFRRAMLAAHLHVGALIGSTMAECGPDFGLELGSDAIGVFASDRPTQGFNPEVLTSAARATYERFSRAWQQVTGGPPTEEGLAGFTAAWSLFHDVLPRAGALTAASIASTARSLDMPSGSLPNGAGLQFSTDPAMLGQNTRAAAVIWQWQAVRHSVTVWPPVDATGTPQLIPLPA